MEWSTHLGLKTRSLLLSDSCGFVGVERSVWQEDRCVVSNCCWVSPAHSFSGPSPVVINDHILLSQIWDFAFRHHRHLTGLWWRYLTPPPHEIINILWCHAVFKSRMAIWLLNYISVNTCTGHWYCTRMWNTHIIACIFHLKPLWCWKHMRSLTVGQEFLLTEVASIADRCCGDFRHQCDVKEHCMLPLSVLAGDVLEPVCTMCCTDCIQIQPRTCQHTDTVALHSSVWTTCCLPWYSVLLLRSHSILCSHI
jgi:hypothetical protein